MDLVERRGADRSLATRPRQWTWLIALPLLTLLLGAATLWMLATR